MDVNCPQCGTLFEFDERQMRGAIATLKCSVCQHLFRIETNFALGREDHRRWMVRNVASGDVLYFSGFEQLHRWIMEGQVSSHDEISRTGQKWTKLSMIGEFSPVFEVVESIQNLTKTQAPSERERTGTIQQFPAGASAAMAARTPSRQPAPSWVDAQPPAPQPQGRQISVNSLEVADAAPSFSPSVRLPPQDRDALAMFPEDMSDEELAQATLEVGRPAHSVDDIPTVRPNQPSNTWSIATESEPELYQIEPPAESKSGGGALKMVAIVAIFALLAIVGFAYALPTQFESITGVVPPGLASSVGASTDQAQDKAKDTQPPPDAGAAFSALNDTLSRAYLGAFARRDEVTAARVEASVVAAMSPLHGAFVEAQDAVKDAKKSSASGSSSGASSSSGSSSGSSSLKAAKRALDAGDSKKAYDLYYKVLDRDSRNAQAFTGLGWTLIQMGRHESAAVQFKRAISIDSGLVSAYLGLAKAERNRGNKKGAILIYEQFLKKFPSSREANIARTQREKLLKEVGE